MTDCHRIEPPVKVDDAFRQRSGLVGAKQVHAAQIFDRIRRRTMTPRLAMARAPRARFTPMIAGRSSGLRPTASATENSSVSIGDRAPTGDGHDPENEREHRAGDEVAETSETALELGVRLLHAQPGGDPSEFRSRAGLNQQAGRSATSDVRAEKHRVRSIVERCVGRARPRLLRHRKAFTGQHRLIHEEIGRANRNNPSPGIRSPALSSTTSPGTRCSLGTSIG